MAHSSNQERRIAPELRRAAYSVQAEANAEVTTATESLVTGPQRWSPRTTTEESASSARRTSAPAPSTTRSRTVADRGSTAVMGPGWHPKHPNSPKSDE